MGRECIGQQPGPIRARGDLVEDSGRQTLGIGIFRVVISINEKRPYLAGVLGESNETVEDDTKCIGVRCRFPLSMLELTLGRGRGRGFLLASHNQEKTDENEASQIPVLHINALLWKFGVTA
jgi:hypothetical protein